MPLRLLQPHKLILTSAEHVFERQAIKSFIITTISGKLPSGKTSKYSGLDPSFWTSTMEQTDTTRAGVNNKGTSTYMGHLMNALGSSWNQKVLALAGDKINGQKLQVRHKLFWAPFQDKMC